MCRESKEGWERLKKLSVGWELFQVGTDSFPNT
jgi:hypothetical protein